MNSKNISITKKTSNKFNANINNNSNSSDEKHDNKDKSINDNSRKTNDNSIIIKSTQKHENIDNSDFQNTNNKQWRNINFKMGISTNKKNWNIKILRLLRNSIYLLPRDGALSAHINGNHDHVTSLIIKKTNLFGLTLSPNIPDLTFSLNKTFSSPKAE